MKSGFLVGLMASAIFTGAFIQSVGASANDLPAKASTDLTYDQVRMIEVLDLKPTYKYSRQSRTSMAQYQGAVDVSVAVEGNICGGVAKTLGTTFHKPAPSSTNQTPIVALVVGRKANVGEMCLQYSKRSEVTFPLQFWIYETPGVPIDQGLGVIESWDYITGKSGQKEIRIQGKAGKLSVVAVDL